MTRSSAIAEGPRDASCQLKSCQLPRSSVETTCTTSREQIEVMKLEGYSGAVCNKHVLVEHRLVTDTDRQTQAHGKYRACIASRGKTVRDSGWQTEVRV